MKNLKLISAVFCFSILLVIIGCGGFTNTGSNPGGVSRGILVGDVVYPSFVGGHTEFKINTDDFDILQTVTAQTSSSNVLGLFASGDNGYDALFQNALAVGADDVINIKVDTRRQSYLGGFFSRATTKLTGTAIRWKKK